MRKLKLGPVLSRIGEALISFLVSSDKGPHLKHLPSLTLARIGLDDIGDEVDELWRQKSAEAHRLFADRSPATLRWYFEVPGDLGSVDVLSCRRGETLIGYAVVRHDPAHGGQRKSIIADLLVVDDDPEAIHALWMSAYDRAKHAGSHVLEVFGYPERIRHLFLQWKPYQRKLPASPFYYKAADPELHKELSNPDLWYASPFDGETTLIRPSFSTAAATDDRPPRKDGSAPGLRDDDEAALGKLRQVFRA